MKKIDWKNLGWRFMSHLSAFIVGIYCYAYKHGDKPNPHQWALTIFFGLFFFAMSFKSKNDE